MRFLKDKLKGKYNLVFRFVITFVIAFSAIIVLDNFEDVLSTELIKPTSVEYVENSLKDKLVECYAIEGAYPNDIKYLESYGFVFDEDKYVYDYEPTRSYEFPYISVSLR